MAASISPSSSIGDIALPSGARCTHGGSRVFGNVRIFKRNPLNAPEVDTIFFLEKSTDPHAGSLGIGADSHSSRVQIADSDGPRAGLGKMV